MIQLASYYKNPNLGILARANDSVAVLPPQAQKSFIDMVQENLGVKAVTTSINGTSLVGALMAMNNNGMVISDHCQSTEREILKETGMNIGVVDDKLTALGNLIICNDKGAVVSGRFKTSTIKIIQDTLDCDVRTLPSLAGYKAIGSVGIANNIGVLVHPETKEVDIQKIEDVLKVPVDIGTVNRGIGLVRTGIIANAKGAVLGENTTGPEIMRIEDALGLY